MQSLLAKAEYYLDKSWSWLKLSIIYNTITSIGN